MKSQDSNDVAIHSERRRAIINPVKTNRQDFGLCNMVAKKHRLKTVSAANLL